MIQGREKMQSDIRKFVSKYWEQFQLPIKLQYITSVHSKTAKKLNVDIRELLESDETLAINMTRRGGMLIVPRSTLPEDGEELYKFWVGMGVRF